MINTGATLNNLKDPGVMVPLISLFTSLVPKKATWITAVIDYHKLFKMQY